MSLLKEKLTNSLISQINSLSLGLSVSSAFNYYSCRVVKELCRLAAPFPRPRDFPFHFFSYMWLPKLDTLLQV